MAKLDQVSARSVISGALVVLLGMAAAPVSSAQENVVQGGHTMASAPDLPTGTYDNPAVFTLEVTSQEDIFFAVDIPDGHRLHMAFTIDPADAPQDARISPQLIDTEGFISSYVELDTQNEHSGAGLRSGYLRSEPMDPAHRSWGRDTVVRLTPQSSDYPVRVAASLIPVVVDGGALEDVDRPALRYAEDLQPVDLADATSVTLQPEETQVMDVPVGWLQAIDATAQITAPGSADGALSFALFNTADEPMVLVGDYEISTDHTEAVTFGQRAATHYKNVGAKNKTRNTGFLGESVQLAMTNASTSPVTFDLALELRGEAVEPGPEFDSEAAAQAAQEVEPVEYELYKADGFEESAWQHWLAHPLVWVLGLLIIAIIVLVVMALRRR